MKSKIANFFQKVWKALNGGRDSTLESEVFLGFLKSHKGYIFILCEKLVLWVFSDFSNWDNFYKGQFLNHRRGCVCVYKISVIDSLTVLQINCRISKRVLNTQLEIRLSFIKSEKDTKSKVGLNDKLSGLGKPIDGCLFISMCILTQQIA